MSGIDPRFGWSREGGRLTRLERSKLRRLEADATGVSWREGRSADGRPTVLIVRGDGSDEMLHVLHDKSPAPPGDVEFIAHSRSDVRYLLGLHNEDLVAHANRIREIEGRWRCSTDAVWIAHLERGGGLGGQSIIGFVTGPQADLYLQAYGEYGADSDYVFIACAHELLPRLILNAAPLSS